MKEVMILNIIRFVSSRLSFIAMKRIVEIHSLFIFDLFHASSRLHP